MDEVSTHDNKSLSESNVIRLSSDDDVDTSKPIDDPLDEYADIVSMYFSSEESGTEFYKKYAGSKGFTVRKDQVKRESETGSIVQRRLVCSRAGNRMPVERDRKHKERRQTRCECQASLSIRFDSNIGKWFVYDFNDVHNHSLEERKPPIEKFRRYRCRLCNQQGHQKRKCPTLKRQCSNSQDGHHDILNPDNVDNTTSPTLDLFPKQQKYSPQHTAIISQENVVCGESSKSAAKDDEHSSKMD